MDPKTDTATHAAVPVDLAPLREAYFRHTQAMLKDGIFHVENPSHGPGSEHGSHGSNGSSSKLLGHATHDHITNHWQSAREMLTNWGFDLAHVERLPIGFFGSAETLGHRLLHEGFSADDIRASNLLADTRLPGRLVGPIRERNGHITSFWGRTVGATGGRTLYLSGRWKAITGVIGLDTAVKSPEGGHDLLMVEDLLDALLLQSRGMPSVVAVGSAASDMTPDRWKRLAELEVQRVTLLLESFRTPEASAVAAIDHAAQASASPAVYVLLGGDEDIDNHALKKLESHEALRRMGYEAKSQLLGRPRLHGFHYRALHIISTFRPEHHHWAEHSRRAALKAAQAFYNSCHPRNIPALDTFFLPPLLDSLGLDWSVPKDRWEDRITAPPPLPVAAPVPQPAPVWEEEPKPPPRPRWVQRPAGDCAKHGCRRNECLCWD